MKRAWTLGIDLGGTKMLIALFDRKFKVRAQEKIRLEANKGEKFFFKALTHGIEDLVKDAGVKMKQVKAVGVGCAGMIRFPQGIVQYSPNLLFLENYPLRRKLANVLGRPVYVENDVNAGVIGEHAFGAAAGHSTAVGIFIGTGIGGGIIIDNKIYHGADGAAGEIGHMFVSLDPLWTGNRETGTLEAYSSRTTLASEAAKLALRMRAPRLLKNAGTDVRKIKSGALAQSVRTDRAVRELTLQKARILGLGLANIANILNPSVIVLGGGLIEALGNVIVPEARRTMEKFGMGPNVKNIEVKAAKLGDLAVAMGAAKAAWTEFQ